MFTPNVIGILKPRIARDIHGQSMFGDPVQCPFAVVNLETKSQKTSVRADSSGSRGAADEIASDRLKILISPHIIVKIEDHFEFDGESYVIKRLHPRRAVSGQIDHFECDLQVTP